MNHKSIILSILLYKNYLELSLFLFWVKSFDCPQFLLITTHIVFIVEIVNLDNFERKIKVDRSMSVEKVLHLNRMTLKNYPP